MRVPRTFYACLEGRSLRLTPDALTAYGNFCEAIRRDFLPFKKKNDVLTDSRLESTGLVFSFYDKVEVACLCALSCFVFVSDERSRCRLVLVST